MSKKLTKKKLTNYISQTYYKVAANKTINILDIGKVFREAEAAYAVASDTADVDKAVVAAVEKYCQPA